MNDISTFDGYGVMSEPATLTIKRLLPGPVDRIWAYITDEDLRRQWFAGGQMDMKAGSAFEFIWRNDELSSMPAERPDSFPEESRMASHITEVDPPHRLSFTWNNSGEVTFQLTQQGPDVLLTITHRRMPDRPSTLGFSAGWHMHLDILSARLAGEDAGSFWVGWARLRTEYDKLLPTA